MNRFLPFASSVRVDQSEVRWKAREDASLTPCKQQLEGLLLGY